MASKILLTGSHGCGKSGGANHLAATLKQHNPSKSIKILEENVREVSRMLGGERNTPAFQKLSIVNQLQNELLFEDMYDYIICDRTTFDFVAYGTYYKNKIPYEYTQLAVNNLNTFDRVYLIRPNDNVSDIADDGFRDTNIQVRDEIDIHFKAMLDLWSGQYKELKTDEVFTFDYIKDLCL